ncbi:hypothetical protein CXF96_05360 [Stenotrophomonas sp. Betaine-02u-21]|nr:hypothetical protein CXF90_15365 [Stenotrophomonas sp. Betaine-02u-23]PKH75166.1 hypothetical protein CXF96_05360 [Stenotrophomonas sp. Betaine-02u-21]PKH97589.1 hypothetical protein CXG43_01790 [Stenotrophomonas sp. Bg11-02]
MLSSGRKEQHMPRRIEVQGYSLVISSTALERRWRGVVHLIDSDGRHVRTIETRVDHATSDDAEKVAAGLGEQAARHLAGMRLH